MNGVLVVWLLGILLCDAVHWEGSWEIFKGERRLYFYTCLDSNDHWTGVYQGSNHERLWTFNGKIDPSSTRTMITGSCAPPPVPPLVEVRLGGFETYMEPIFLGSIINFIFNSPPVPFDLQVTILNNTTFQALNIQPEPGRRSVSWATDKSLLQYFPPDTSQFEAQVIQSESAGSVVYNNRSIYLMYLGEVLTVRYDDLDISVTCSTRKEPDYWNQRFYPTSSTPSSYCEDYPRLWVGRWQIHISPPLDFFGEAWFVCQSPSSGDIVSSFGDLYTIATSSNYLLSQSVHVTVSSINGQIVYSKNLSYFGDFWFQLSPNQTSFNGWIKSNNVTYNIAGTLWSSADPYSYLCSPFEVFGGLWIENRYSSWVSLCVDKNLVYGSYFGGAVTINGYFYYTSAWNLHLNINNVRTVERNQFALNTRMSTTPKPLIHQETGAVWANPESRTVPNCRSIPVTWGTYLDVDFFSTTFYMCTGMGNTVYGTLNGTSTFYGTLSDVNVINGKIVGPGLSFVWILERNNVTALYKDENGVSASASMYKITDQVTLSQCSGNVLISAYVGIWSMMIIDTSIGNLLYLCQASDNEIEGFMDPYYFSGSYKDGKLTGIYRTDTTTGVWNAQSDLSEKTMELFVDNSYYTGDKMSVNSNTFQCASWRSFWKASFGTVDVKNMFGGCFSICFQNAVNTSDFSIIFFSSEIIGNGTMDPFTGSLRGTVANDWSFTMEVTNNEWVLATFIHPSDTTIINYTLCSNFPGNYSTTDYPNCIPTRYENFVIPPSVPYQRTLQPYPSETGGVDITADGTMAIVASGSTTFVMEYSAGSWGIQFEFDLPIERYHPIFKGKDIFFFRGSQVAITNTHAFIINGTNIAVYRKDATGWGLIGNLVPPNPIFAPFYMVKSFSDDHLCYLEVTWVFETFVVSLYNISSGEVDLYPIAKIETIETILAASVHTSWLIYSTYDPQNTQEIKVYYCPLSQNGLSTCSSLEMATVIENIDYLGLGFSVAVNSNYLFVGYPSSQNNNGSVYVYKYSSPIWRLTQILYPPDSGFHQSFGRTLYARETDLFVLKAQDNTLKPYSMALFSFTLSSKNWVPRLKFISEDWPTVVSYVTSKRQYVFPTNAPLESTLYWTASNNGTLFITSPNLGSFIQTYYSCLPGFWGQDCSSPCPCSLNSTCIGSILGYTCLCIPNTYGTNCDQICEDCNGALCDDGSTGTGICLCNSSQYGPNCLPCSCKEGTCSSGPNGTGLCDCNEDYTGPKCDLLIERVNEISTTTIIILSVAIPCVAIAFMALLLYFLCVKKQATFDISVLPEEIRWYFDAARIGSEGGWTDENGYQKKDVKEDKKYLKKLNALMELLEGKDIEWSKAYVIYNSTLQNNFLGFRSVTLHRHNDAPNLFHKNYKKNEKRDWVMEQYNKLVNSYEWNLNLELPILPVIHGTDVPVAKSICATGFAALSSLDAGFYGKGIYATSSCLYALPYYANKEYPAILICLTTPGNVAPIIEDYKDPHNWLGKPIQSGFQSHYVLTAKDGKIAQQRNEKFYDEIVLPTESQLVPIYLLTVEPATVKDLLKEYERDTPTTQYNPVTVD